MSTAFTWAAILTSVGTAGAAVTASVGVIAQVHRRRNDKETSEATHSVSTSVTIRYGDRRVNIQGANAEEAIKRAGAWLQDNEAEISPKDGPPTVTPES
jgi:hypothetical protein